MVESATPRSIGALDGSLPQVLLAGGNRRLAGPAELGVVVRHWPGRKGIVGDIDATAILTYIKKGCDLKKDANPIYIVEVVRSKVGEKTEVIHQISIFCVGKGDKLGLCNFELDAVTGHKLAHGGEPTRSEIRKIDGGGFKQMKAGAQFELQRSKFNKNHCANGVLSKDIIKKRQSCWTPCSMLRSRRPSPHNSLGPKGRVEGNVDSCQVFPG
jgi:hypothetical protein